jgi:hypothetical protein
MTDRSICGLAAGEEAPNDLLEAEFSGQNAKVNIVGGARSISEDRQSLPMKAARVFKLYQPPAPAH